MQDNKNVPFHWRKRRMETNEIIERQTKLLIEIQNKEQVIIRTQTVILPSKQSEMFYGINYKNVSCRNGQ